MLNRFPVFVVALLISSAFCCADVAAQGRYAQTRTIAQVPGNDSPQKITYSLAKPFTANDADKYPLSEETKRKINELLNDYPLIHVDNPRHAKNPGEYILRMDKSGIFNVVHMSDQNLNNPENQEINAKRNALIFALKDAVGQNSDKFDMLWKQRVVKPWLAGYLKAIAKQQQQVNIKEGTWMGVPKVIGVYSEADGNNRLREVMDQRGSTVQVDSAKAKISREEYDARYEYAVAKGVIRKLRNRKKNPIVVVSGINTLFKMIYTFLELGDNGIFKDISESEDIKNLWKQVDAEIQKQELVAGQGSNFVLVNPGDDIVHEVKGDGRRVPLGSSDFDNQKWMTLIAPAIKDVDLQ